MVRVDNPHLPCDRQNIDELDNLTVEEAMELEGIFPKLQKLRRGKYLKSLFVRLSTDPLELLFFVGRKDRLEAPEGEYLIY